MIRPFSIRFTALALAAMLAAPIAGNSQEDGTNYAAVKNRVPPSETGSYIVIMTDFPLVVTEGRDGLKTLKAINRGRALARGHDNLLNSVGVSPSAKIQSYTTSLNGFAASISRETAQMLAGQRGVALVVPNELRQLETDSSPDFLGLTARGGVWQTQVTGKGVVVGVIDSGIWPEHPSFADDGKYKAPHTGALPCDFGDTVHNANDLPFACNNKLIGAQEFMSNYKALTGLVPSEYDSARDDDGHGTHTASTAAGNSDVEASINGVLLGTISGIAPRAHVSAYKACGRLGCYSADLVAAIDQAVADGVDVINYSIGSGPSGPGADDIAFLFAADAGVHVATSAGNSGPGPFTVGSPGVMPWLTTVGASTQPRFFKGEIELGNGAIYSGASITEDLPSAGLVDASNAGGDLCIPGSLNPAIVTGKIVLCRRGVIARAAKSLAVSNAGGVGTIIYENSDDGDLMTDTHFTPTVHIDNTPGTKIKDYINADPEPTASFRRVTDGKLDYAPSMTSFSSRGPNLAAPDIIKPDITAPGIQILAGYSPTPDPNQVQGQLFAAIAGTSMSSPHIAGAFALIKQVHPDWSPAMAKSALMTSAYTDVLKSDRTSPADPFDFGAGHVDLGHLFHKGSSFQPGLAYDAGFNEYIGFLCAAFPGIASAGTCQYLADLGVPTVTTDLNYPSIGVSQLAGSITVKRTVVAAGPDYGARVYYPTITAPPGYTATVSPRQLKVNPGESATYELTILNHSAPVGEWRFGEIEWIDLSGKFKVRSPIAVAASELGYPGHLSGSGVNGTASIDVMFGYTGSYSAAPLGLVPATVTTDNVVQDPDQTFNPYDGYSNMHTFALSGARHFRIAMPPDAVEPDADLDIFVYSPGGYFAASSTGGGTDELIDIPNPADGTWTVFVHGWSTPGGDTDYDLFSWAIPATPGTGNLAIASAPSSAVVGQTGTIELEWTNATAGQWHVGAVSHNRSLTEIGLTIVEVDNR